MKRRDFCHTAAMSGLAAALWPLVGCAEDRTTAGAGKRPPNVIYILADDLGYGDLSIMGQKKLRTPNIDRIGREGLVFSDHYSGNTVCSPSRAVLMTGQHPGHAQCRSNRDSGTYRSLDPKMVTLPRLFKNAGYATGAFGKWGLGTTSNEGRDNPLTHGFDVFSGWKSQMIAHTYYPTSIVRNGKEVPLEKGTFIHDLIMTDALDFVGRNARKGTPFFAYIPTAVPHAAMHAPKELHEKWRKVFPQFDNKIGKYGAGRGETCPDVVNPIAGFAAMIENLDNQIGQLLDLLHETGADENTLVLFASDNGAHLEGGHDPKFWNSNGPLRGHKRDYYDGGIRSPFLARWPGVIQPGRTSAHISGFQDILPTMAELTGQPVPKQTDGLSLLPTLRGDTASQKAHEYLYWEDSHAKSGNINKTALRQGPWKIVRKYRRGRPQASELFNLTDDLGEENNIAAQHPVLVQKLEALMLQAHKPREAATAH